MLVRSLRLLLVVALLGAWHAALVHPIGHVDQHGQHVHLGEGSDERSASCDVLAALTACAPQAEAVFIAASPEGGQSAQRAGTPLAAEAPPFLSQGPPAAA